MDIDEHLAAAEKSISSASKNKMFGVLPKTLVQLCKAVKAGMPNSNRLIEVVVEALIGLDEETLLKVGPDMANLFALANEKNPDCIGLLKNVLERVGRLDNDLVVFALRSQPILAQNPKLIKEIIFDLVKFYYKPQSVKTEE